MHRLRSLYGRLPRNPQSTDEHLFVNAPETYFFWGEILIGIIAPIILLAIPKIRRNPQALFWSILLVIIGFVINRLNVSITAMESYARADYFPSWMEISVTLMIVALGFAAFRWVVKHLPIFEVTEPVMITSHKPIRVVFKPKAEFAGEDAVSGK